MNDKNKKLNNATLKEQLKAVKQNGLLIRFIKHPYPKVQLEAVREDALAIFYINNPCAESLSLAHYKMKYRDAQFEKYLGERTSEKEKISNAEMLELEKMAKEHLNILMSKEKNNVNF